MTITREPKTQTMTPPSSPRYRVEVAIDEPRRIELTTVIVGRVIDNSCGTEIALPTLLLQVQSTAADGTDRRTDTYEFDDEKADGLVSDLAHASDTYLHL